MTERTRSSIELSLKADAAVDLHMHTTYSDGRWPAQQLIDFLAKEKFDLVAVTDHDRVDKVVEIRALAARQGLPVIPGVEMTTSWQGKVAHLLCYGFDPEDNELAGIAENVRLQQLENTQQVNAELQKQGFQFPRQAEILAQSGGQLYLPIDNATLLREHGHAHDLQTGIQMMYRAGFRSIMADLGETVEIAHRSGAVCIFAHPGRSDSGFTHYTSEMLDQARAEAPFDGVEVYHPYHSSEMVAMYLDYVTKHQLLLSTGSDTHCTAGRMPIKYRAETSRPLLERLGVTFI